MEASWRAAEKIEAWAGELRVNLLRLTAIAAFYGHHLLNVYVQRAAMPPRFHLAASGLAGHEVSPGARDLLDRIERGVLTYDEAVAEVIAEFGQPAR